MLHQDLDDGSEYSENDEDFDEDDDDDDAMFPLGLDAMLAGLINQFAMLHGSVGHGEVCPGCGQIHE